MHKFLQWSAEKLAEELPATLFVSFNGVMAWMTWSLRTDLAIWRDMMAAGEHNRVPFHEPRMTESILAGLPSFWITGALLTGALAIYWHAQFASKGTRKQLETR